MGGAILSPVLGPKLEHCHEYSFCCPDTVSLLRSEGNLKLLHSLKPSDIPPTM